MSLIHFLEQSFKLLFLVVGCSVDYKAGCWKPEGVHPTLRNQTDEARQDEFWSVRSSQECVFTNIFYCELKRLKKSINLIKNINLKTCIFQSF